MPSDSKPSDVGPHPFPCGGSGQPACPPQPAVNLGGYQYFTLAQMLEHGHNSYQKALSDRAQKVTE
jgi:hypothetical protein